MGITKARISFLLLKQQFKERVRIAVKRAFKTGKPIIHKLFMFVSIVFVQDYLALLELT